MNLIDGTLFKTIDKVDEATKASVTVPGRLVPRGRKRVAYRKMVMGLIYLGLYVVFGSQYNLSVQLQDWFVQKTLLSRYVRALPPPSCLLTGVISPQNCYLPDLWLLRA